MDKFVGRIRKAALKAIIKAYVSIECLKLLSFISVFFVLSYFHQADQSVV